MAPVTRAWWAPTRSARWQPGRAPPRHRRFRHRPAYRLHRQDDRRHTSALGPVSDQSLMWPMSGIDSKAAMPKNHHRCHVALANVLEEWPVAVDLGDDDLPLELRAVVEVEIDPPLAQQRGDPAQDRGQGIGSGRPGG